MKTEKDLKIVAIEKPSAMDKLKDVVEEIKKETGLDIDIKNKSEKMKLENAMAFLKRNYDFRNDTLAMRLYYRPLKSEDYAPFNDRDFTNTYVNCKLNNIGISKDVLRLLIKSKYVSPDYDPFKEYLLTIPKWDRGVDEIDIFLRQIILEDERQRENFVMDFKKWFTNLVASLLYDRVVNQQCFVLVGRQGRFKTTFLNSIVPQSMQLDYLYSSKFNFESKDHFKYLGTKMLVNLDELASFNRTDIGILKTVLTDDRVITRFTYAEFDTMIWRRASFCGSTNNDQFLKDETGNRRFLVYKVSDIKFNKEYNISKIYAQALGLIESGFKYYFDRDDQAQIESNNDDFHDATMEEEIILQYFEKPSEDDIKYNVNVQYATATGVNKFIAMMLGKANINESTKQRTGAIMVKLGYKRITQRVKSNKFPVKVYAIKCGNADFLKCTVDSTTSATNIF